MHLRDADEVWLRITDDGIGFEPAQLEASDGFGLTSMRERTQALGGRFEFTSQSEAGSSVEVLP